MFSCNCTISDFPRNILPTILATLLLVSAPSAFAATGCTLNDPDRDIRRLFPEATNYRTEFISIAERGGAELAAEIEEKLDDRLEPIYESLDVPYAFYTVLRGDRPIGRVHGVNQKGMYGGMQLILATDLDGRIRHFYYQKISSPEARRFRDAGFTARFAGLSLADFLGENAPAGAIADPSEKSAEDFRATLRGIRKNLILLDVFMPAPTSDDPGRNGGNDDA